MVLDRGSELYEGAVTASVDDQRSARALTGLGTGELEAVCAAMRPSYRKWANGQVGVGVVAADTEGLTVGKEHIVRCGGVLTRSAEGLPRLMVVVTATTDGYSDYCHD